MYRYMQCAGVGLVRLDGYGGILRVRLLGVDFDEVESFLYKRFGQTLMMRVDRIQQRGTALDKFLFRFLD